MNMLSLKSNQEVDQVFNKYPASVKRQMLELKNLIIDVAEQIEGLNSLEETLKWGEPSYISKHGSTIRMDWKSKTPDQYAIYFKCTSRLVPTFKSVYPEVFRYEGNRAITFQLDEQIPQSELKKCIKAALLYHKVKHLPLLGM